MTTLVTGSTGLVGTALQSVCEQELNNYIFLSSKDCDLTDYNQTLNLLQKYKPTTVVHLAGHVGGLFKNMDQKVDMFERNLQMNFNIVKCSYLAGVTKFIGCLSTCIFPDDISYPISEEDVHKGAPHDSNYGYAYAKRMLDIHCRVYREKHGLNYFCITPTNIYGENDNYNLADSHVIPGLIHKCYLAKQSGRPFVVLGTGTPLRQFIYSKDLAKIIKLLITTPVQTTDTNQLTNLIASTSPEDEVSIATVAKLIAKNFDYLSMLTYDTTKSDGQFKKTASNKKLMDFLNRNEPDFRFTSIEDGIKQSVKWFKDNYMIVRK